MLYDQRDDHTVDAHEGTILDSKNLRAILARKPLC